MDKEDAQLPKQSDNREVSPELGQSASDTDFQAHARGSQELASRPPNVRRQSSFAQARANGTPRTPNRVRFDVDDPSRVQKGGSNSTIGKRWSNDSDKEHDEDAIGLGINHAAYVDEPQDGQKLPLLHSMDAPGVTMALDYNDFNPEDLLESARPKSGMRSAFMNMANSIMYVCRFKIESVHTNVCHSGAGIIGQPYAFRQAGLITGIILLICLTITVDWTIRLIVVNSKLSGANSFQATMQHCYGRVGLIAISLAQWALLVCQT